MSIPASLPHPRSASGYLFKMYKHYMVNIRREWNPNREDETEYSLWVANMLSNLERNKDLGPLCPGNYPEAVLFFFDWLEGKALSGAR